MAPPILDVDSHVLDVDSIQQQILDKATVDPIGDPRNKYLRSRRKGVKYGRRLLVTVVDERAKESPDKIWASMARSNVSDGLRDVTIGELSRAVNFMSWWLEERLWRSKGTIETISYIGAPDVRYGIIFLAAIKLGYKICHDSTISGMLDIGKKS